MECTVAVVDDGSVVFRGVADVLRESPGIRFAGLFRTLDECLAGLPESPPTVVVVDPVAGPALPRRLPPQPRLLVMSASRDRTDVCAALGAGAGGYIDKGADVERLIRAIGAVAAGDLYLDGELRAAVTADLPTGDAAGTVRPTAPEPGLPTLTPREQDVLRLIAVGLTHKQIGARLGLSKATVDTYVHRVRQKTGIPNKAGLTRIAMRLRLLSPAA